MAGYLGPAPVPQSTQTRQTFTATSGQTTFATGGYQPNYLSVYLNGIKLIDGTDYTATNGSDVVLTTGAATGDTLEVVAFSTFTVASQNFTGGLTVDNNAATVLTVDRATSDGTIIDVQKGGVSVGTIGSENSHFILGRQDTGLKFHAGVDSIIPHDTAGAANRDAAIDLGYSSGGRFRNLYLSGGVYLGGTGSANRLDDYEEGAFTVGFTGATISTTYTTGYYTKIGQLVHWNYYSGASNISGAAGNATITGLPYIVLNSVSGYEPFSTTHNTFFGGSSTSGINGFHNVNTTTATFCNIGSTNASVFVNGGSQYLMVSGTYITPN